MNQPNLDHPRHDVTLIAGHAAGDLMDTDRNRADALLASCRDCADLHRDLLAITAATRSLPARAAPTRDFRLTPAQAERLRRGSWLRRILRPFAATRSAVRPMATAFTSLGIAGLLVAAAVPGLFGSAASLARERASTTGAGNGAPAATTAPAFGPGGAPVPQAGATPNVNDYGANADRSAEPVPVSTGGKAVSTESSGPGAIAIGSAAPTTPSEVAIGGTGTDAGSISNDASMPHSLTEAPQPNLLLIGSLALLAIGLVLFGLRLAGRRLRL